MDLAVLAGVASVSLTTINLLSIAIAAVRLRRRFRARSAADMSGVSIIRPLCGAEPFIEETLKSSFALDYPEYELIFCVADSADPVVPIVRRLISQHPHVAARLLTGDHRISANPKLNNCVKGWHDARHEWIILADSNVLMPTDYVQHMMLSWRDGTGLVCATPIGARPRGFWAEVECAFLNTLQARWQYCGESLGLGFAQGKSMLWQRAFLDARGGLCALASEIAEDAAATKLVRAAGLSVHLVSAPFEQPLGSRRFREVWGRQARWARLRRVTFPLFFAPECLTGAGPTLAAAACAALASGYSVAAILPIVLALWYGPEALLAANKGWHLGWRFPLACLVRDGLLIPVWIYGWVRNDVIWRGTTLSMEPNNVLRIQEHGSVP